MIIISTTTLGILCGLLGFSIGINYMFLWQRLTKEQSLFKGDISDFIINMPAPNTPFAEKTLAND